MNDSNSAIIDALKKASEGLLFTSESDFEFEVFLWESRARNAPLELTTERLLEHTRHSGDIPIEVTDVDSFFESTLADRDWHGENERSTVARYRQLVATLKRNLTDLSVYRVGAVEIDVYIVGKTQQGDLAGLATKVVET